MVLTLNREHQVVASKQEESIEGAFQHLIFSPKGLVEGVLICVDDQPAQLVFDRHDEMSSRDFETLSKDQTVVVRAKRQGPSPKGESEHKVYAFIRLVSVDGRKPIKRKIPKGPAFKGTVARFNYARHGEPNGVVLDTGDFIHTKPQGFAELRLKLGDKVGADGESRFLGVGRGRVVEAVRVNGRRMKG